MKKISLLLLLSLSITSAAPLMAFTSQETVALNRHKKSLGSEIKAYLKCIKGDRDCDPEKKKIVSTAKKILVLIGVVVGGTLAWKYFVKKREKKRKKEIDTKYIEQEVKKYYKKEQKEKKQTKQKEEKKEQEKQAKFEEQKLRLIVVSENPSEEELETLEQALKNNVINPNEELFSYPNYLHAVKSSKAAEILIKHHADIDFVDPENMDRGTPLMSHITSNQDKDQLTHNAIAKKLIERGADVNKTKGRWNILIQTAISKQNAEMFVALLKAGAKASFGDWDKFMEAPEKFQEEATKQSASDTIKENIEKYIKMGKK